MENIIKNNLSLLSKDLILLISTFFDSGPYLLKWLIINKQTLNINKKEEWLMFLKDKTDKHRDMYYQRSLISVKTIDGITIRRRLHKNGRLVGPIIQDISYIVMLIQISTSIYLSDADMPINICCYSNDEGIIDGKFYISLRSHYTAFGHFKMDGRDMLTTGKVTTYYPNSKFFTETRFNNDGLITGYNTSAVRGSDDIPISDKLKEWSELII